MVTLQAQPWRARQRTPPARPVTAAIATASMMLNDRQGVDSASAETLRDLLDETERIRLEVLALDQARQQSGDAALRGWIDGTLTTAGAVLDALAAAVTAAP